MKKRILILIALAAALAMLAGLARAATLPTTLYYGDITLPAGGGFYWQPGTWDLTVCPVTVSYTLDLSGAPNVAYTGNYGQSGYVGLVWPGSPWAGAWMSGFLADGDNAGTEFPTYPDNDALQDLDDKFNMQRSPDPGSWSETMYDVYCATNTVAASPFGSWDNYGIWFDRDGVDQWQATHWGMVDGGTYNTWGVYDVQILYRPASSGKGTACPVFFPNLANDDAPGGFGVPTGFNRSSPGPGYDDFPAGISFDTDATKMGGMQVFVRGDPGNGTIVVRDLQVTGCLATIEVAIDIKPESDPNSINTKSKGVIPVAILGSATFDVTDVDVTTLNFEGADPAHDLTDPDVYAKHLQDVNADGFMDLVSHYRTQETDIKPLDPEACLTGETTFGNPISGCDSVRVK